MNGFDSFDDVNPEDLYPPDWGVDHEPPPLTVAEQENDVSGDPLIVRWKASWLASSAVQFRQDIGAENLLWFKDHACPIAQFAAVTKRVNNRISWSDREDWLNKVADGHGDASDTSYFMALGKDAILAICAAQKWADQHHRPLSEFYRAVAVYLTKYEPSTTSKDPDAFRLLELFKEFVEKESRLPRKDEIENRFRGSMSAANDSNRTTFNRLLRKVGLDGLPDRLPTQRRRGFGGPRDK
mgnify:CR=1 FL=1